LRCSSLSLVARCDKTGQLGVGTLSATPAAGALVPWAEAGVGAVAMQGWVNPSLGRELIELLRRGKQAEEALQAVLADDARSEVRQILVVGPAGDAAAYTGEETDAAKGHILRRDCAVAGNHLDALEVLDEVVRAYDDASGDLAERIGAALEVAEARGSDGRGVRSGAILVVPPDGGAGPLVDLRVDDHRKPAAELVRLLTVYKKEVLKPH